MLKAALIEGIRDAGAQVIDLGLTGTEEIYFASCHLDVDGGVEVTASHNPADYNGMKFVGRNGRPIGIADEFKLLRQIAEDQDFTKPVTRGAVMQASIVAPYMDHILSFIDATKLQPMTVIVDAGNGAAGHVVDALEPRLGPLRLVKINTEPDGNFSHGVPNPLLPERRAHTIAAVLQHKADFGVAWDGDFDRCFLFDGNGAFVPGQYVSGFLMQHFLAKNPNEMFVIDPRLTWNSVDVLAGGSARVVTSRTGHMFFKQRMREVDAVYGGETSAHHYFRNFAYCDSGMIPWLLIAELLSTSHRSLAEMVAERAAKFPSSEEINFTAANAGDVTQRIAAHYASLALATDHTDGLSMEFGEWRFNLRASNTEALLRLNVEARGNARLVDEKVAEISRLIRAGAS